MSLVFLTSLAVIPFSAFIYRHSSTEFSYLSASILLVSFFVSLVFAPWPLQLLLLSLVLLTNKRQLWTSKVLNTAQDEKKNHLVYRGVKYDPTPPLIEMSKDEMTGKYRGQIWRVRA